ncbi:SpoIIE family protein phosphatase [Streptomyces sp. NPDC051041]|uniref:SpoIIE family protein phosphatase n=1 Tax=Streptomyces sp. NPDC051041 TaxID=3365640 RepID=UPI00379C1192
MRRLRPCRGRPSAPPGWLRRHGPRHHGRGHRGHRRGSLPQCPPSGPMGTDPGLPVTECVEQLEPGDRLLSYTDGVVGPGRSPRRPSAGQARTRRCAPVTCDRERQGAGPARTS